MKRILLIIFALIYTLHLSFAQDVKKDISEMTKEDVMELTYDELLEMPFEDLLKLAEIVGVSLDELYEMILNKDVVSASKKVESSFESPLSTSVISYDEIKASGARTIEEALRLVPGMIVREKTNGNFDVHIRGNENLPPHHMLLYSENSITLVMIDGRPVYNYVHGGTFWETLPIDFEDIDRIEVVRGPSSALYGPNAVSGVVNIITKKQQIKEFKADAHVEGGNQNTLITSIGAGKGITDNLSFRVTGNFQTMDRNSELLYAHDANEGEGGYIARDVLDTLRTWSGLENQWFYVFDPSDDIMKMYPDPINSRDRYGVNGYIFYDVNDDIKIDLKGGYQRSEVLSTTMGDNPTSYAGRVSNTGYIDLHAGVYGLKAQINYMSGWQDIVRADNGFKIDMTNLNANLEYDFHLGDLNLSPGFAYQLGTYDDMPFLEQDEEGFLNGKREISSTAFSLRADYLMFKKLRLIGAIRGEKYSTQDVIYPSFQIIGSYNLKDSHFFRLVYSRANRGPFLVDSYANYRWVREGRPAPGVIYYQGNKDLDLLTMHMIEFGYRVKPVKSIQADLEVFMLKAENYSALYPDSVNLDGFQNVPPTGRPYVNIAYRNIDLTTRQLGVTASVSWVVNKNLVVKVYGTFQETRAYNVISVTPDATVIGMIIDANLRYQLDTINRPTYSLNFKGYEIDEEKNLSTPDFYGGLVVTANALNEKLWINTNLYSYTSHTLRSKYSTVDIESKLIWNAKISYRIYKENATVFINVKNILGQKREFAYMDEIGTLYLFGAEIKF
ncbi:MAG: TonB-dependent receptor plug domain-containing protein [Bacteroidales bacterium]|nr:TonB-dependent receptor plug domain-containing protein [Bacteroidales bacterium]